MKAQIISHDFCESMRGTPQVVIKLDVNGQTKTTYIYVTEKSYGIARDRLAACGFDIRTQSLASLHEQPSLLCGNTVEVERRVEPYNGREIEKFEITTHGRPIDAARTASIDAALRALDAGEQDEPDSIPF